MSARHERWSVMPVSILDAHLKEMDASTLKVYLYLTRWANGDGVMWHGQARIAEGCGISVRTVIRALGYLKSIGALTLEKQGGINRGTNHYNVGTVGRKRNGTLPTGDMGVTLDPPTSDMGVTPNVTPVSPQRVTWVSPKVSKDEVTKDEVTARPASAVVAADDRFEEFWEAFPKQEKLIAARKAYAEALKETTADVLVRQAKGYARKCRIEQTEPGFIVTATSWLAGKRWTDTYPSGVRKRGWAEVAE